MYRFVKQAVSLGMSRSAAYKVWSLAIQAKRHKVFAHLLNRIGEGCLWSEVMSAARRHGLDQEMFIALKKRYFVYDPCRIAR